MQSSIARFECIVRGIKLSGAILQYVRVCVLHSRVILMHVGVFEISYILVLWFCSIAHLIGAYCIVGKWTGHCTSNGQFTHMHNI